MAVFQRWVRIAGLVQIVLGGLLWTSNQLQLIPLHMLVGTLLVFGLWVQAGLGAAARVETRWVAIAAVWGVLTIGLGMNQAQILPGEGHWVVLLNNVAEKIDVSRRQQHIVRELGRVL